MTAGIVIDKWKLLIFKKDLDTHGYKYIVHTGLTPDSLLLKEYTSADTLGALV